MKVFLKLPKTHVKITLENPILSASQDVYIQTTIYVTHYQGKRGYIKLSFGKQYLVEKDEDGCWFLLEDAEWAEKERNWRRAIDIGGYYGADGVLGPRCVSHVVSDYYDGDLERMALVADGIDTEYKDNAGHTLQFAHEDSSQYTEDRAYLAKLRCKHRGCNVKIMG